MKEVNAIFESWQAGSLQLTPFVVTKAGRFLPRSLQCFKSENQIQLTAIYDRGMQEDLYFTADGDELICRRLFSCGNKPCALCELGIELTGLTFGGSPAEDYFYHNENPRIYERMTFPVDYDRVHGGDAKDSGFDETAGNRWADPGVICQRIGYSPYQPFPAILLSNYQSSKGLVHGTLSQRVFFHNYLVSHENSAVKLEIFSGFKDTDALQCKAGKILVDEWYLGMTDQADKLEKIFERYARCLRKHLPPLYGATKINRDNMVWGSWNDGILRNISEEMLLQEARFLKTHFPTVRWIQIDDGYAVHTPPAHGLGMPYEGEAGVDYGKFPAGLRHTADKIRSTGLRPAIWIGGFCPKKTPIYQEHPEWFLNYDYRVTKTAPLDVSRQDVREYMEHALDVFFREYAFEGMKHDFWSYAFEDSHDLYQNKDHSGYELRDWWLKEIRKRLPADAYLQTGCDLVMGNPFLAEYFTNYRYGIDVGAGNWSSIKPIMLWGCACFATHTGDLFVPNSDAVGLFPGLNDTDALFLLNYCMITHSMVEIAGKLSEADPESPRFKNLKKAVCCLNNGQDVFLGNYDYRDDRHLIPRIFYCKTPHFSTVEADSRLPLRTVGIFNTEEEPETIHFSPETLELPAGNYLLTDIWNGETVPFSDSFSITLPPHGSRQYSISLGKTAQILSANVEISLDPAGFILEHPGDIELFLANSPQGVFFNQQEIPFQAEAGNGCTKIRFSISDRGILSFTGTCK